MITLEPKNREKFYKEAAKAAFKRLQLSGECVVELVFASEEKIRRLNRRFRDMDKPTDVLSFPLIDKVLPFTKDNYPYAAAIEDGKVLLGSIVICRPVAQKNAGEYGHSLKRELCYLFVHGLLHLLGYDHMEEEQKKLMRSAEESILEEIGELRT